jgi:hypothetical protein
VRRTSVELVRHHPANEHCLAFDLRVEREQRIVPRHLRQSEVDQVAEIVRGEAEFE